MTHNESKYARATLATAADLGSIARSPSLRQLTRLTLPEIEAVVDLISRMVPAGNVPGVILSGLARLPGRKMPPQTVQRDVSLLFKGVEQALDTAMYGAFFAGPAAVIWGYQNLLRLAGKDPDDAFPEGVWQFYANYALRDDTARHASETHGFDSVLKPHGVRLDRIDRITAWVMAAIHCLHQYPDLLENEWRERVYTALLREVTRDAPEADRYARLYREWELGRPYARGSEAAETDYPAYRRNQFDRFLLNPLRSLRPGLRREWDRLVQAAEERDLPAYQRQMSIVAYLEPGAYGETRTPIPIRQAHVGVIYQSRYYLIPICAPGGDEPADVSAVRAQIASITSRSTNAPSTPLVELARVKRTALAGLRGKLEVTTQQSLDALRTAPILFNADARPRGSALSELRQAERGVGDHALTLFDTGETIVFDQSHIFFDGAWGAALAEIMTNEALSWAVYLHTLPPARPGGAAPAPLRIDLNTSSLASAPHISVEAGAENDRINVKAILSLRKLFRQRNDLLQITVNDLLLLYRAIHAVTYQLDPDLLADLQRLARDKKTQSAAQATLDVIEESRQINPSVLIPVDAGQRNPRDRLYPLSFEVPLKDLDLLDLHKRTLIALEPVKRGDASPAQYAELEHLQRTYLATLAGFGAVSAKAKDIAIIGKSASVGTLKLMAHMPAAVQRLLDRIPGRLDVLNDLIKGREVMSNIGAVAPGSTLTRFMTAKDDNEKKSLAWGILTDANGALHITLRDFRPHVALLHAAGRYDLARRVAQDYLDAYADGLNGYVHDLQRITLASRPHLES